MIKIIHTADIHLDSPLKTLALRDENLRAQLQSASRQSFGRMVDYAIDEKVAALLISGDLFDSDQRSAKTAAYLLAEFDRLAEQGIEVFYIKGNHDAENPITGGLPFPSNVHVFSGRGGKKQLRDTDIWIHGVSFSGRHAPDSLLDKFPEPEPHAVNIAMLHTSLAGSAGHDVYAPCSVDELKQRGFDYWALGHVHKRQIHSESPWIVMPGIPQGRDIGEPGAKTATILFLENDNITTRELPTSSIEFVETNININSVDSEETLRSLLRSEFATLAQGLSSQSAVVRLRLSGQSSMHWSLIRDYQQWHETLSQMAADTGRLWIEKLKLDLTPASEHITDSGPVQELSVMMSDIRKEEWFVEQAATEIDVVLKQLSAAQRKQILETEDDLNSLAERLGSEGCDHLIAVMRGEGS